MYGCTPSRPDPFIVSGSTLLPRFQRNFGRLFSEADQYTSRSRKSSGRTDRRRREQRGPFIANEVSTLFQKTRAPRSQRTRSHDISVCVNMQRIHRRIYGILGTGLRSDTNFRSIVCLLKSSRIRRCLDARRFLLGNDTNIRRPSSFRTTSVATCGITFCRLHLLKGKKSLSVSLQTEQEKLKPAVSALSVIPERGQLV